MILTRYAMRGFEFGEELLGVAPLTLLGLFETLANALACVGESGDIQETLVGLGVLDDGGSFALYGEHHRAFALLKLLHEIAGPAPKRGKRLNVFGYIEHGTLYYLSTFLSAIGKIPGSVRILPKLGAV
jgi:hypothetical protein